MLTEIRAVRQDADGRRRHWFQDDFFDLFAWTDAAGDIVAFQLCYDRLRDEHVLAWSGEAGFAHRRIDDGEDLPGPKMSPLMVADGRIDARRIADEFERRSGGLDARWRGFVLARIAEAARAAAAGGR